MNAPRTAASLLLVTITTLVVCAGLRRPAQMIYPLSVKESLLTWKASYVLGGGHEGHLHLASGQLFVSPGGGTINGGHFIIDMNTITNTDEKEEGARRSLEKHLKNKDFFEVNRFPTGTFSITAISQHGSTTAYTVTGDLTLKGIKHPISFPATILLQKDSITATATTSIDRTKWGINHQSGSIFSNLKDGIISDRVNISMKLRFKKPA